MSDVKSEPFSIEDGFQRCTSEYATNFCNEKVQKRMDVIAPLDPKPVKGGFVPLNNIFNRI